MTDMITPIISFFAALAGGLVAHFLSMKRERASKRRELVTKHLLEIWPILHTIAFSRDPLELQKFTKVVADIQLFGSEEMILMVKEVTDEWSKGGTPNILPLVVKLRDSLRDELGLPATSQGVVLSNFTWTKI